MRLFFSLMFFLIINFPISKVHAQILNDLTLEQGFLNGIAFTSHLHEIPLADDIYDGVQDGLEEFLTFPLQSQGGTKWVDAYTRILKITEDCNSSPYQEIFFDDFNEPNLDEIWRVEYNNNFPWTILLDESSSSVCKPENVQINDGYLHLITKTEDLPPVTWIDNQGVQQSEKRDISSGVITSSREQVSQPYYNSGCYRFGKFSIRAKIPQTAGVTGAYWFSGWPGEIDIFEICATECDEIQTNFHQWNLSIFNEQ